MTPPEPSSQAAAVEVEASGTVSLDVSSPQRRRVRLPKAFISFEEPDFRYLGLSTLALGFGQWAQQIGLAWLALDLTGSAVQLGAISAFRAGVGTLTAPLGGFIADRYPRRMVIIWSTASSVVQASLLAFLIITGWIELWHVYVLAFAGGVIQSFTQPARQAFVYDISTDDTLVNAVAMNSMVQNIARVAAPPLTGAMIAAWGNGAPFATLAGTQVVAIALTLLISKRTRQIPARRGGNAFRQVADGFVATWRDRRILGLMIVHTIPTLLVVPYLPFLALVSRDVLGRGAQGYGALASMAGWGALLGLGLLAFMGDPRRKGLLMLGCFFVYVSSVLVFAVSRNYALSLLALGIGGVFSSVSFALNNTLLQIASPNEVRGRVMSVWQFTAGLQPLGALPMGILIQRYGPALGMGSFMVAALVAFGLFTMAWGSVRRM
jgi:MFS family permease